MKHIRLALAALLATALSLASPVAVIPVTDANVRAGLSPYNWIIKDDVLASSVAGASLTVGFKGTKQVRILVDSPMALRKVAEKIPTIGWTVNGGPLRTYQFGLEEKSFALTSGEKDPVIDLYIKGITISEPRWDADIPMNSLKILGFEVDAGATTKPVSLPPNIWLTIGDDMMSGDGVLSKEDGPKGFPAVGDARASYAYLLTRHFGGREARLAFFEYNWMGGRAKVPALTTLIDQHAGNISRLTDGVLKPAPAVVLINLGAVSAWWGAKGVPTEADVVAALKKVRSRVGRSAKLLVQIPLTGIAGDVIRQAFDSYKRNEKDAEAFLIDAGKFDYAIMSDKRLSSICDPRFRLIPSAEGHQQIFKAVLSAIETIVLKKRAP